MQARLAAIWLCLAAAPVGATPLTYSAELKETELEVTVSLDGLNARAVNTEWAAKLNIRPQVEHVRCDSESIPLTTNSETPLPDGCNTLKWRSELLLLDDHGAQVGQQSFYSPKAGWGLVSAPASLLTLNPGDGPMQFRLKGPDGKAYGETSVDAPAGAPAFIPFGSWPTFRGDGLVYRVDDPAYLGMSSPWPEHLETLAYFDQLFDREAPSRPVEVIWVGQSGDAGGINGAAGQHSLLINYPKHGDVLSGPDRARALYVLLHEQFHQRAPAVRISSTWLSESTASYYALKALQQTAADNPFVEQVRSIFIDTGRPVTHRFTDIDRQIAAGDRSQYFTLYTQGATFWFLLDELISESSAGADSLDDYMGEILRSSASSPSDAILQTLPAAAQDGARTLLRKFAG